MSKAEKLTTVCGSTIFVTVRMLRERGKGGKRAKKHNPTTEAVKAFNQRIAERALTMLLNYNFKKGDLHLQLTYAVEPSKEQAKKDYDNFIRKLRKHCREHGYELKAIMAVEYRAKRMHFHVIVNCSDIEAIARFWNKGLVRNSVLDGSGDYSLLAHYIIKETSKDFRSETAVYKRRYTCTRSVERPVTKVEEVSAVHIFEDPQALPGYFVIPDSVYRGSNLFTERPYIEYTMRSLDVEAPRITRWRRGRVCQPIREYKKWLRANAPEQLNMFEPEQDAQASL